LLTHLRTVQAKHDKARRQALGGASESMIAEFSNSPAPPDDRAVSPPNLSSRSGPRSGNVNGTPGRNTTTPPPVRNGALSPLNPRARASNIFAGVAGRVTGSSSGSSGSPNRPASPGPTVDGKAKRATLGLRKA
jgi:vacuole morphology and inheritance protein 14